MASSDRSGGACLCRRAKHASLPLFWSQTDMTGARHQAWLFETPPAGELELTNRRAGTVSERDLVHNSHVWCQAPDGAVRGVSPLEVEAARIERDRLRRRGLAGEQGGYGFGGDGGEQDAVAVVGARNEQALPL